MEIPSVIIVPVLSDNYAYIVMSHEAVVVIDPGEARQLIDVLDQLGRSPTHVLITHYDFDHINGLNELTERYKPRVIGVEPSRVPLDQMCSEGDNITAGDFTFRVIDTPGHYVPHVSFYEEKNGWLFSGDCLFGSGCGRVRNNAYGEMFESLQKLMALPDETRVYFGHEYTLSNLAFAASVEPGNTQIDTIRNEVATGLARSQPSVPSTIEREKQTNPFLRTSSPEICKGLGMADAQDSDVFTALRKAKNSFSG